MRVNKYVSFFKKIHHTWIHIYVLHTTNSISVLANSQDSGRWNRRKILYAHWEMEMIVKAKHHISGFSLLTKAYRNKCQFCPLFISFQAYFLICLETYMIAQWIMLYLFFCWKPPIASPHGCYDMPKNNTVWQSYTEKIYKQTLWCW